MSNRLFAVLLLASACASAQNYPTRPIRIVVPYPPGGAADNTARVLQPRLIEALGQQIVLDNRSGASEIGRAHVLTPVTLESRMPSSA